MRTDTVTAVVLAAGRSSRMGRAKQLVEVDGIPMVLRAATVALQSAATTVVVVTGAYAADIEALLQPLRQEHSKRFSLLHNAHWETGQASSVCCAVAHLHDTNDALLFLPVDQPFVPVALLQQLITTWQAGALLAAPAIDGKIRGAPAIFDRRLFAELSELEGDVGARPLLQRYRSELASVPAQEAWLQDIDTPEDFINIP